MKEVNFDIILSLYLIFSMISGLIICLNFDGLIGTVGIILLVSGVYGTVILMKSSFERIIKK